MLHSVVHTTNETVNSLCFCPHNGKDLLVSTSGDGTTALWDVKVSSERIMTLNFHKNSVNDALPIPGHPEFLLTGSDDRTVAVWDLRQPSEPVHVIRDWFEGVNKLISIPETAAPAMQSSGPLIASGSDDGKVNIHQLSQDMSSSTVVDAFCASFMSINDIVVHDNTLITASEDCRIASWRLLFQPEATLEDRLIEDLHEFEGPVNHLCVVPEGTIEDPPLKKQEEISSKLVVDPLEDDGGEQATKKLPVFERFSPRWILAASSQTLFATDYYGSAGIFGEEVKSFIGHDDFIRGIHITAEGTLFTVSDDFSLIEWDPNTCSMVWQARLHNTLVMSSAMTAKKDILATGSLDGEIRVWGLPFKKE